MSQIKPEFQMNVTAMASRMTSLRIDVANPADWGAYTPPDPGEQLPEGALHFGDQPLYFNNFLMVFA